MTRCIVPVWALALLEEGRDYTLVAQVCQGWFLADVRLDWVLENL